MVAQIHHLPAPNGYSVSEEGRVSLCLNYYARRVESLTLLVPNVCGIYAQHISLHDFAETFMSNRRHY